MKYIRKINEDEGDKVTLEDLLLFDREMEDACFNLTDYLEEYEIDFTSETLIFDTRRKFSNCFRINSNKESILSDLNYNHKDNFKNYGSSIFIQLGNNSKKLYISSDDNDIYFSSESMLSQFVKVLSLVNNCVKKLDAVGYVSEVNIKRLSYDDITGIRISMYKE